MANGTRRAMDSQSHVFAFRGNIKHLECDAWILPTDRKLSLTPAWLDVPAVDSRFRVSDAFREGDRFAEPLPGWSSDAAVPVLTAVPYEGSMTFSADVERRVVEGLDAAADVAAKRKSDRRRQRPLVALPLFGTGGGGAGAARGEFIGKILQTAREEAVRRQIDVALVLFGRADEALAQRIRREDATTWAALPDGLKVSALRLAEVARAGALVPFMGAGVSYTAGLPLWSDLVASLSEAGQLPPELRQSFAALDVLDQAVVLRRLFEKRGSDFRAAVVDLTSADRYGLAPVLLAGLRSREAVTLNYDALYELAAEDVGNPVTLLPDDPARADRGWLLKLHGSVSSPSSIVLTRDDYLSFGKARAALASLAKAMLLTRHLLFVGFGFRDDHFHELMHEVREVLPKDGPNPRKLGTALMLREDLMQRELWGHDVDLVAMPSADSVESGRHLEIMLDMVLAHAREAGDFFLDDKFQQALSDEELLLKQRILRFVDETSPAERRTAAWATLEESMRALGMPEERR
jgi:hypothetical protein